VQPRYSVSGWEDIHARLGGLEICTGEIQNTLHTHVQDSAQWHQQQQQQMAQINVMLQQQREQHVAYWRFMGFNPRPQAKEQAWGRAPAEVSTIFIFYILIFALFTSNKKIRKI